MDKPPHPEPRLDQPEPAGVHKAPLQGAQPGLEVPRHVKEQLAPRGNPVNLIRLAHSANRAHRLHRVARWARAQPSEGLERWGVRAVAALWATAH
jgi:hypothetical protein